MIAQKATTATALRFDGAKHIGEVARIVTGVRHNSRAQQVGFGFVLATVFQEIDCERSLSNLPEARPAQDCPQNAGDTGPNCVLLRLGRLCGAMTQSDVT